MPITTAFEDLEPEQLRAFADDALKRRDQLGDFAFVLYTAFLMAASDREAARAYRRYLEKENAEAALLAHRFVQEPKVTIEDREHQGWVILIHSDTNVRQVIRGGQPFQQEGAERIAEWIRAFGAHAVEHAKHEPKDNGPPPCPFTGTTFEEVQGYIANYGCPLCRGLATHLPIDVQDLDTLADDDRTAILLRAALKRVLFSP